MASGSEYPLPYKGHGVSCTLAFRDGIAHVAKWLRDNPTQRPAAEPGTWESDGICEAIAARIERELLP